MVVISEVLQWTVFSIERALVLPYLPVMKDSSARNVTQDDATVTGEYCLVIPVKV